MSAAKRKDPNANGPTRPLMPRLAASAQSSRTGPAPRLAGYNTTPPIKRSNTTHTTPIPATRTTTEEKVTPVSSFVNANITPRSSSRKSRQFTPIQDDETPPSSRPASTLGLDNVVGRNGLFASERPESDAGRTKSQLSLLQKQHQSLPASPSLSYSHEHVSESANAPERQSYFFHANQGPRQEKVPERPQHKKTGSFVYANGTSETTEEPHINGSGETDVANGAGTARFAHVRQKSQPHVQPEAYKKSPSVIIPPISQQQRQPSPPRQGFHLTYRKGASQVMPPQPLSPPLRDYDVTRKRTPSIDDDGIQQRQSRTFSVTSVESGQHVTRKETGFPFLSMFPLPSAKNSPIVSPVADSLLRSSGDRDILQALDADADHTQSPPSAVGSSSSDPHRTEAAAHARRERKIMDLEISNSSLLVINRSLEKEVRRQKAELRRARRLSRKTSLEVVRASSGRLSLLTEDDEDETEEPESSEEESDDAESEDSFADESMSPGAITQRDVRHRKQDQLRLKKDLAKHKELLADSQKMNQSLKRCMSITESLIQEGNRAIAYQVNHDDIQLGGRVLSADEINGDVSSSRPATPLDDTDHLGDPHVMIESSYGDFENTAEANINGVRQGSTQSPKAIEKRARNASSSELLGETF